MFTWRIAKLGRYAPTVFCAGALLSGIVASSTHGETPEERLKATITVLASDEFEGRSPGTPGETKTVNYLVNAFKHLGLEPGNPNGTFVQDVPLVGITSDVATTITTGNETLTPEPINEWSARSHRVVPEVTVKESELVFVGYGVVAPEYQWDDYKGLDVRGKTLVMLVGDPPVMDPKKPGELDDSMFRGRAMTYYGRWTYKYEIAAEKGAAACIIIHETGPAGYPFAVLGSTAGREEFDLRTPDKNLDRAAVEAWMTFDFAKKLFTSAGQDLGALKATAATREFHPVPLKAKANFTVKNKLRDISSQNVVAKLPGHDASRKNEYVIFTAHWDHLGRDERLKGDQIFNGAADNASGTAELLEIAQQLRDLPAEKRPARTVLFLSVTAEEKGLLGSRYYAENPLYPLAKTIANVNMDGANHFGKTRDIEVIGSGSTTIEDIAREVAAKDGRILTSDTQSEKGFFYRSDHFEFAKVGVPAFYPKAGRQPLEGSAEAIDQKRRAYIANDYHKVSDEIRPDWDFGAMSQEVGFLVSLAQRLAADPKWPEWKSGNEFKARRDAMLRQ